MRQVSTGFDQAVASASVPLGTSRTMRAGEPTPPADALTMRRTPGSEPQLHRDLDVPLDGPAQGAGRVREHGGDLPEGGVAQGEAGGTGVGELRVVQEVERFHPELVAEA